MFQPNPTTKDSGIVPHQTAAHKRYLLDIIDSGSMNTFNSITKDTVTNQSSNWGRWCTFLKHSVITYKLLGGIPQDQKTMIVSSFATSVRRNQFGTTRKQILLHRTVKFAISDVSMSFRTHIKSDPTLDSSGQTPLLLQRQLRGYKTLEPTTKHQNDILEKLVLHIYMQTNTHLNTAIGQLIAGKYFFGMRSCNYSTTTNGEDKLTCIIQKGDIHFYRKRRKIFT